MSDPYEGFRKRELEKRKCLEEAVGEAFKTAGWWLLGSAIVVGAANKSWPAFRRSLGVSGKTALIVSPPFGMYFLKAELVMNECARRKTWKE